MAATQLQATDPIADMVSASTEHGYLLWTLTAYGVYSLIRSEAERRVYANLPAHYWREQT